MDLEEVIIGLYIKLEKACGEVLAGRRLRQRGPDARLTVAEVLTIEVFSEMQGHHDDTSIWRYTKAHWQEWFPALGSYSAFAKQCANLWWVREQVLGHLFPAHDTVHITDGVPLPVCHRIRAGRSRCFRQEASYGYCAAKDELYYGFKGHILISLDAQIVGFTLTPANVDEREVLAHYKGTLKGMLIGDKGLLCKQRQQELAAWGIDLQTPLRNNMIDNRPNAWVRQLMKIRRRVETVIGQLTEHFQLNACKAKNVWHLTAKLHRKILAYNLSKIIKT